MIHRSVRHSRKARREGGVALILAIICLLIISALAAGIIFSTQSEMWTTANYRSVAQARYAAEAGVQQAVSWLQTWTPPASPALTDAANFSLTSFPVKYLGSAGSCGSSGGCNVVLNATAQGLTGTYAFDATTNSTFSSAFTNKNIDPPSNSPTPSGFAPNYTVSAQLLEADDYTAYGGWVTTWKVFSQGTSGKAKVQLVAIVNKVVTVSSTNNSQTAPGFKAAILATGTGCNAIVMNGGNNHTNAYDSAIPANQGNKNPTMTGANGDVISYGNMSITSGAKIFGNYFTPFYNSGAAGTYGISNSAGNGMNGGKACGTSGVTYAVNEDNSGSQVGCTSTKCPDANSGYYSKPVVYNQRTYAVPPGYDTMPDPVMPSVAANTSACTGYNGLCNGGSGGGAGCAITIPPSMKPDGTSGGGAANFGKTNFGSCAVITLQPGVYNFDTLYISNGAKLIVPTSGYVIINILNNSNSTTPLNVDGGTVSNSGGDPNNLTFVYAGNQTININAGAAMFATVYAPKAKINSTGGSGLYGAIVGNTFTFSGSGMVNYDINLGRQKSHVPISGTAPTYTISNMHIDQLSWSAY